MIISKFPPGIKNLLSTGSISIREIYSLIKNDESLKQKTILLRGLSTKEAQSDFKCKNLDWVTFGGIFSERKDTKLKSISGLLCLDLDDIPDPPTLKKKIAESSTYPVLLFLSPRGTGLKIVVRCNSMFSFKTNYEAYTRYFSKQYSIPEHFFDKSCASISKACFLCNDPNIYINPKMEDDSCIDEIPFLEDSYFNVPEQKAEDGLLEDMQAENFFESPAFSYFNIRPNFEKRNSIESFIALSRICNRANGNFQEGNRHNWLLHFSVLCNSFGMNKNVAITHFKTLFGNHSAIVNAKTLFDEKNDLIRTFDAVYEKYCEDFGRWDKEMDGWETPFLSDTIFQTLPVFFKKLTDQFTIKRERDVFFLGLLTLLSSCFPKIQGIYDHRRYRMNLFLFVSAPAASGKGVLSFVRMIGEDIQKSLFDFFMEEQATYESLPDEDKKNTKKPELKKLFIPANNTSAKIIQSISTNKVFGVISENEADTLTNANKSEHGHFTELLRKAFHHEVIEYERKTNKEYISISDPALSIMISGTPRQVNFLIRDFENGLASRFIFYNYTTSTTFKDVFADGPDLNYIFKNTATELYLISKDYLIDYILNPDEKEILLFSFTDQQRQDFHQYFSDKLSTLEHIYGSDIRSSINRLGLIFFRIAMVLSTIRQIENKNIISQDFKCDNSDFEITKSIIETLIHHSVSIFNLLKTNGRLKKFKNLKEQYLKKLPDEFNRQRAMEIAALMEVKEKTAEHYLTKAISEGILARIQHNHYKKINQ